MKRTDYEILAEAINEQVGPPVQRLKKAYRSHSGFKHDPKATAQDVVDYEANELGNEYLKNQASRSGMDLTKIPASHVTWVTGTKKAAKRYGADVGEVSLHPDHRVIAADLDGGFLIHNPPQK